MQNSLPYTLKGNLIPPKNPIIIGNLINDAFGKFLIAKYNEQFKSRPSLQMNTPYLHEETIRYSNVPFNHFINQLLLTDPETLRLTGGLTKLLTVEQAVANWTPEAIPDFNSSYSDFSSVVVYTDWGLNEDLRQRVLKLMEIPSTKVPLIVSNLGVEPAADNKHYFTFTRNDFTKCQEAPFLEKDQNVSLNLERELEASEGGVPICAHTTQLGVCRLYRSRYGGLNIESGLLISNFGINQIDGGRVQLIMGS